VFKFSPLIEKAFRKRKKQVGKSWRMDETYIKVKAEQTKKPLEPTTKDFLTRSKSENVNI
jgi:hypothetical protein